MNDSIKIVKSFTDSNVLTDGITEALKHQIKKTRTWISWSFVSSLSRFISVNSNFFSSRRHEWKGVTKAGRLYMDKTF